MKTYLVVIFGSMLVGIVATLAAMRLARALRIVDAPGLRKVHSAVIPRTGGIAIFVGMWALVIPVLMLDNVIGDSFRMMQDKILAFMIGGAAIFGLGLVDDIRGLRASAKLVVQIIVAIGMCAAGIRMDEVALPGFGTIEFGLAAWPLTVLWIIAITNALNLIDGLDGLAGGIAAIVCMVIAALAMMAGEPVMAILMLALLGSVLGFLVFNFNPARIFMGDCGSLFLGFSLATASTMCAMKTATVVAMAVPALAMGVPVFDMVFSMVRRLLARRSPFAPDQGHIHHRLLDLGFSQRHAVLALYAVTSLVAALAVSVLASRDSWALVVCAVLATVLLGVFRLAGAVRLRESLSAFRKNWAIAREAGEDKRCFENSQLRLQHVDSFEAWWNTVCETAEELAFGLLTLTVKASDGSERTYVWQQTPREGYRDRMLRLNYQVQGGVELRIAHVEAHIGVNGSLEAAARRGALFGRLLDDCVLKGLPPHQRRSMVG